MSAVLDFFRQREPKFNEVPDEQLMEFIAQKHPQFLQDAEFAQEVQTRRNPPSLRVTPTFAPPAYTKEMAVPTTELFDNAKLAANADRVQAERAAQSDAQLQELLQYHPLYQATQTLGRAGKVTLAAGADLASLYTGEPSLANLSSFANRPDAPTPVEEGLAELKVLGDGFWSGAGAIGAKASAALLRTAPALGTGAGLAALGAPAAAANALALGAAQETGGFDPIGATIAAGLPGVTKAGEVGVAKLLEKLPTAKVVVEVLSRDPLKLKGKVVQRLGNLEISNDVFRKYLEAGGGLLAANAYLDALAVPQIMMLPPSERHEAALDAVAGNLAMSLSGFTTRKGTSLTLENMMPKLRSEWVKANAKPGLNPARPQLPAEEGAPVPRYDVPVAYDPFSPTPETTPAPMPAAPSRAADSTQAASQPGAGNAPVAAVPAEPPAAPPAAAPVVPTPPPAASRLTPDEEAEFADLESRRFKGKLRPEEFDRYGELRDRRIGMSFAPAPATPAAPEAPAAAAAPHPGNILADDVAARLRAGETLQPLNIRTMGGTLGLDERQSGEWAELGATEVAREIAQQTDLTDREKFHALVSLYERMPTNGTRTVETKTAQQYSTPPALAWVASVLADFKSGTSFAEPTAGHGMLLIGAPDGATVRANELLPERAVRLNRFLAKRSGAKEVGAVDAATEQFHQWLARPIVALDRVGMNPPFGSVLDASGKSKQFPIVNAVTKAKTTPSIDLAIALNTFEAMTPDGKGFAIIGSKTGTPFGGTFGDAKQRAEEYRRPVFMEFFERFNVVDWFTVGGDLYRKMGAAWPVDVIIIHGKGKTKPAKDGGVARPWVTPPRLIETWEQLAALIPEHSNDNIKLTRPSSGEAGGRPGGTDVNQGSSGATQPGKPPVDPARPQSPAGGSRPGGGSVPQSPESPNPTPEPPAGVPGDSSAGIGQGTPPKTGPVASGGAKGGQSRPPGVGGAGPVAAGSGKTEPVNPELSPKSKVPSPKPAAPVEGLPASLMVKYQGVSKGPSLNLVAPRNIATQMLTAQLALEAEVQMPIDQYVAGRLGMDVAKLHGSLSGAQIDAVALAIRNIERGSALITADETGVGKGRIVAALLQYARRSNRVPIFVTAKKNLYADMVGRDLPALGNKDFKPFITDNDGYYEDGHGKEVKIRRSSAQTRELMEQTVRTGNLPEGAHGIFTTYDQLKADRPAGWSETPKEKFKRKVNRSERPDGPRWAMLRALAPRALFILDEAHLAAGLESELNLKFSSILPNAGGMYYSSATFAKRPDNLGLYALGTLMKRSGLNHEQLAEALTKGGVPMQQALTSMLAESGELVRRQQDWTGVGINFKATSADPANEIKAADTYTGFIRNLMQLAKLVNGAGKALEDGENQIRADEETVKMEPITFGSRLFNLSNQYLLALRSDAIVKEAIAELKAGRKPFIALYNTMEGPLLDLRARKLPLSFNGILLREMQKMLKLTVRDPMAEGGKREVELQPEDLPDGGAFYRALEQQITDTDFSKFPISPIDYIKQNLQAVKINGKAVTVGELTARDGEVDEKGGELVINKREKANRNKVLKDYNDGVTDVIIVNGSGSTGLSAHTDPKFKDQRQRAMIVGQPAPDINEFMQMLGRVMRSGQTSKPIYKILTTALAAERRFATMLRGKMTSLNANTTAEGESGMTQSEGFAEDIFNQVGDEVVFRVMQANTDAALMLELGVSNEDAEVTDGFARQATGRFVLLPNAKAQQLWGEIITEFKNEIAQLDEKGENPLRATAEDLRARTIETSELVQGTGNTPFDGPATLEKAIVKPPKAPPTHPEALQRAKENLPTIKQAVREWLDKSKAAEEERINEMRARGDTDNQIDIARAIFQTVRHQVAEAQHMIGDTFGVDFVGDGTAGQFGVAAELKLADDKVSAFASASRQMLVLTTNTFKGKLTIPLSKLANSSPKLILHDEADGAEQWVKTAESSGERHIITGNLLRGWEAAEGMRGGSGGRHRVAIYTREDGSLNTGILMPAGWDASGAASQQVIQTAAEFQQAILSNNVVRSLATSSVHPVVIQAQRLMIPSGGNGKLLWGDPAFNNLFSNSPQQQGNQFVAYLDRAAIAPAFEFLKAKGVRLVVPTGTTADMRSGGGGADAAASRGGFVSGVPNTPGSVPPTVTYGAMHLVRPLQLPELVRLTRELSGALPRLRKLSQRGGKWTMGQFSDGMVTLDPRIFKDPEVAAKVLAHELGHLVDYLPHDTLKRGNLLGHLLALRSFLRQNFSGLNNKVLRNELLAVTMWWRPYNPATDPKSYVDYRQSPEELYADALSVLFNAPGELEKRAPEFYKAFWGALGKRPLVESSLFAIQDLLNKGMMPTAKAREENLESAFARGEELWKQAVADRERAARSWDGWWTRLWQELYWNFYPLEQRAARLESRGTKLSQERDPRKFLDDLGYRDVTVMAWGRHIHERVIKPIEDAGMTLTDAGKFLFYTRVLAGDRSGLANPGGLDPRAAQLGLLKMNLELKLPKMTLLRDAIRVFHEDVFKLAEQAVEVGAYSRATFNQVIKPNKDSYATFAVLDYLDDYIPAGIRQQIGTLKDVANPFQATILKSIGLINLIAYQRAKNQTVDFLRTYYPADLVPANTQHEPPARKGFGTFMRLEDGRPTWYYTDPYIADAFNKMNPRQLWWLTRAADGIFRKIIYPLIITYNPAFLYIMSPLRDIQRTARNLPGFRFSVGMLPKDYAGVVGETGARYGGQAGPLIREMEANLGLGTPFDQLARAHRDDFMADLLKRMRVLPDHQMQGWYQSEIFAPIRKLLDGLEWGGMTLDATAKVAAYRKLRQMGMTPKEAAFFVRNYAGLPNINKKGLLVRQLRALTPFWNVFVQGWRADLKQMSHPTTRAGWWWRYMASNGLMRALLALGATGALGAALKALFDGISEYDKTNYASVPVGQTDGGDFGKKTVYVRIPEDETARLLGGIISKSIRALGPDDAKLSGIFDFGMGQFPSFNPALTVPNAWAQYATGHNPADPLRGTPIVPAREWQAGGWDSLKPMGVWTIGQTGVPNFIRWDPTSETTWELSLSAIPGINKFIKVSDQGYREQQRAAISDMEAARAKEKLKLPDQVQSIELEYWRLNRMPAAQRTPEQVRRYEDLKYWYSRTYRPAWEAIQQAAENHYDLRADQLRRQLETDSRLYYRQGK